VQVACAATDLPSLAGCAVALIAPALLGVAGWGQAQDAVPPELVAAQRHRTFVNGHLEWTYEVLETGRINHWTYVFTESDFLIRARHPALQINMLYAEGKYWRNTGGSLAASVGPTAEDPLPDGRTLGMLPLGYAFDLRQSLLDPGNTGGRAVYRYDVTDDGPYRLVTTYVGSEYGGEAQIKQWIDPAKGWSVVRAQHVAADGQVMSESVSTLADCGGIWFPESILITRPGTHAEQPYGVIRVHKVLLNDPSLPTKLKPEDIGIEVGTNVYLKGDEGRVEIHAWDGQRLVPFGEMAGRVNRGELQLGPNYQVQMRRLEEEAAIRAASGRILAERYGPAPRTDDPRPDIRPRPGEWEVYVTRFIRFYELDLEQSQKAWSIYRECKDRAETALSARREELRKFEREKDSLPDTADRAEAYRRLGELKAEIEGPVVKIFEQDLKPRLRSLLTRRQLARGEMP